MKVPGRIACGTLLVALGFVIGRTGGSSAPEQSAESRPVVRERDPVPSRVGRTASRSVSPDRMERFFESYRNAGSDERQVVLSEFSAREIPESLRVTLDLAGVGGLDYLERRALQQLLLKGWKGDPQGSLVALRSVGHDGTRGVLLAGLVQNALEEELIDSSMVTTLIEDLAGTAGVKGLGSEESRALGDLAEFWYGESPSEMRQWVLGIEKGPMRREMVNRLISAEAPVDFEAALELAAAERSSDDSRPGLPRVLFEEAAKRDAGALLRTIGLTEYEGTSASGSGLRYAEGFDFAAVLNGLAEMRESLPEGRRFEEVPNNILEEWSKTDPQAAYDWVLEDREVTFNSGIGEYLEGYGEIAAPDEWSPLLQPFLEKEERHQVGAAYGASVALLRKGDSRALGDWLRGLNGIVPADDALAGLLKVSAYSSGDEIVSFRARVFEAMGPGSRLDVSKDWASRMLRDKEGMAEYSEALTRLGHSRAEIDAALARLPER